MNSPFTTPVRLIGATDKFTTGIGRYTYSLYQALSQQDIQVELVGVKPPPFPAPLVSLVRKARFDLNGFFTTYPVFLPPTPKQSLVHLTSQNQASALLLTRKTSVVVTVHDLITLFYRHDPEITSYMKSYRKFFDNLSIPGLKRATALIADSEYTRQDIIRHLKYPSERVKVVYPGLDHESFRPVPVEDDFYNRHNLHRDTPYLLYVGSEDPRKNLHRLLQAFAQLLSKIPEARLIKLGTNLFAPQREQLVSKVAELGLTDKVLFFDHVAEQDLVGFYNIVQAFVFPSLLEGFGWPPLEAMACGTPVIASNRSSLPEALGEAALYINPYNVDELANAMEQVLSNTTLAQSLKQKGPIQAAQFTWEKTAQNIIEVYAAVVN